MNKFIGFLLVSIFVISCTGKTAIGYNDTIIKPQLEIVNKLDSLFSPNVTYEEIQKHRLDIIDIADNALTNIKKLEDYNGNSSFKMSAVKYFTYVSNYYLTTPNVDSLIYYFNSPERLETLKEDQLNKTKSDFDHFIQLENELLNEQKKFAEETGMKLK
jgi:hypothetical protein